MRDVRVRMGLALLVVFGLLVAGELHGSSIACSSRIWAPTEAMDQFVASSLVSRMGPRSARRLRPWLRAESRWTREDEWGHATPAALAQFAHTPRFPVVNTLMGNGANMLLLPWAPVVHLSAIARPVTWGYLGFGEQAGLAWSWWWPSFSCFLALYLLFDLLLPRRPLLGAVGAAWYVCSAYVAGWSEWPAYFTSFAVFGVVCAYHGLRSSNRRVVWATGVGLGWALAGFAIQLYPPWQIPLALTVLCVFFGLVWRDRLWQSAWQHRRWRMEGMGLAVAVAGLLLGSFALSSLDALQALAGSVYPGQRRLHGGDFPDWKLFGGLYNYFTARRAPVGTNESEASGFFMLFPAVFIAGFASRRIRSRLDPVARLLMGLALLLTFFSVFGVPDWLAAATLLSRCQAFRAQIGLGLVSIILSVQVLAATRGAFWQGRSAHTTALAVLVGCGALYLFEGVRFQAHYRYWVDADALPLEVVGVSLAAAGLCATMTLGMERAFAALLGMALFLTSWTFNPLSRGFPEPRESELGRAIAEVLQSDPRPNGHRSLWLTLGDNRYSVASTVQTMGARTLGGYYLYPQLDLWRALDPERREDSKYNRFAFVVLQEAPIGTPGIQFFQPSNTLLRVQLSPLNPALRHLGARYVLTFGSNAGIGDPPFTLLYSSADQRFAIWEIPPPEASL